MQLALIKESKIKLLSLKLSASAGNAVDKKKIKTLKKEISILLTKINSIK